jgi:hypothetical protein
MLGKKRIKSHVIPRVTMSLVRVRYILCTSRIVPIYILTKDHISEHPVRMYFDCLMYSLAIWTQPRGTNKFMQMHFSTTHAHVHIVMNSLKNVRE